MSKASGRAQTRFVCQSCGESFLRWEGQCRACSAWNSLVETQVRSDPRPSSRLVVGGGLAMPGATRLVDVGEPERPRIPIGIGELDRVLGGGLVPGSVVLLGGEPGIGKSTLLLQAAAGIAGLVGPDRVLYATGEESIAQVRLRAERLGLLSGAGGAIHVLAESSIDRIGDVVSGRAPVPALLVIDSVQTATIDDLDGPACSVGQVRGAALRLMELAKPAGIAVVLVGHVTKDGSTAGPKTPEHPVDAVLTPEGGRPPTARLLRASKNRFGSPEGGGVFEMGE